MLIACETTATIAVHLRKAADQSEIKCGGHANPVETLCGLRVGWDLRMTPEFATCQNCRTLAGSL